MEAAVSIVRVVCFLVGPVRQLWRAAAALLRLMVERKKTTQQSFATRPQSILQSEGVVRRLDIGDIAAVEAAWGSRLGEIV